MFCIRTCTCVCLIFAAAVAAGVDLAASARACLAHAFVFHNPKRSLLSQIVIVFSPLPQVFLQPRVLLFAADACVGQERPRGHQSLPNHPHAHHSVVQQQQGKLNRRV